jgi:hypothetical protein
VVGARGADVDEDRVVLGRPAVPRPATEVVGPDELVEEGVGAEELVEQPPGAVRLAEVEVQVQRAVRRQQLADRSRRGRSRPSSQSAWSSA